TGHTPPRHIFGFDQFGKFNCTFFGYEEVVVMKLNSVSTPFVFDIFNIPIYMLSRFGFPPRLVNWHHRTKRTGERAAYTGMISHRMFAQISTAEVPFIYFVKIMKLIIRQWRQRVLFE